MIFFNFLSDIALNKSESEGDKDTTMKEYKHLNNPQSYRASLLQVVQAAYWAFMQVQFFYEFERPTTCVLTKAETIITTIIA